MIEINKILLNKIIDNIPRILGLLDKNQLSSSYGSFDRKFWQYKIIDFPCGMQQELVLPLAYIYKNHLETIGFNSTKRVKEYLKSIFCFHSMSCHSDGSLDDYFPHERAFGATAYSLAALTEAEIITEICSAMNVKSLEKSGAFLSRYREKGLLANHLAIASVALINLYHITKDERWKVESEKIIKELLTVQDAEGWFPEYGGCDIGYQSVTVEFLARYLSKNSNEELFIALDKACKFLVHFIHPDGSFGGEYGSRNTYNFYPGGFALLADRIDEASTILSGFKYSLLNKTCNYLDDDATFGHMLSSYTTVLNCKKHRLKIFPPEAKTSNSSVCFDHAGMYKVIKGDYWLVGNITKGGVYKIFKNNTLIFSDTGIAGRLENGTAFCQNNANSSCGEFSKNTIKIKGELFKLSDSRLKRIEMIGLRTLSIFFGWLPGYSNWIRGLMQKILIYKRGSIGLKFERIIDLSGESPVVVDKFINTNHHKIVELFRSSDCNNMHVVTSSFFQKANLISWEPLPIDEERKITEYLKTY